MGVRLPDFYRGLASLLRAGMVVEEALKELRSTGVLPATLADVAARVGAGETLSSGLARHPALVPAEDVALIEAGEVTGSLDRTLDRLALLHDERRKAFKRLVMKAAYPLLIFHFAALCVPIGLSGIRGRLDMGWAFGITLAVLVPFWAAVGLLCLFARRADNRAQARRWLEHVPGFGAAARHQRYALFASVLEASYEAGIRLDRGVTLAAHSAAAPEVAAAATAIEGGEPLGSALMPSGFLGSRLLARLATAEKAGELGPELRTIADEEFAAAETTLDAAVGAFTKGFYALMALLVLLYALSILLAGSGAFVRDW